MIKDYSLCVMVFGFLSSLLAPPAFGGTIYISTDSAALYTYDTEKRTTRFVGSTGVAMNDIAFDSGGRLWGVGGGFQLYRIDPGTGFSELVGPLDFYVNALASAGDGSLYAAGGPSLYRLNKETGESVYIGGMGYISSGDLEFDPAGNLYLTAEGGDLLLRVDLGSGAGTVIGGVGVPSVFGMAYHGGAMFGIADDDVYTIDLTSGVARIRDENIDINGAAYGAATPFLSFAWPVGSPDIPRGHYGACAAEGGPGRRGCYWLSANSEDVETVRRDVHPFQKRKTKVWGKRYGYSLGASYDRGGGDLNEPVYPIAKGRVARVVENVCQWGNIIFVSHVLPQGTYTSMYAHVNWLDQGMPALGREVSPAEPIAAVGRGEWSKGGACKNSGQHPAHLYFELRKGANVSPGSRYTNKKLRKGPQGQIDPNLFISSMVDN